MAWRSKWLGLWKNNDSEYYHSAGIGNKDIIDTSKHFRIVLKKNKQHRAGDNRPPYVFAFADTDARSYQNDITSRDLQYLGTDDSDDYDEEEKQEPESVVSLETAISIATSALHSMEYGSSIDDLVVEVDSSMRANCFDAVRTEE